MKKIKLPPTYITVIAAVTVLLGGVYYVEKKRKISEVAVPVSGEGAAGAGAEFFPAGEGGLGGGGAGESAIQEYLKNTNPTPVESVVGGSTPPPTGSTLEYLEGLLQPKQTPTSGGNTIGILPVAPIPVQIQVPERIAPGNPILTELKRPLSKSPILVKPPVGKVAA